MGQISSLFVHKVVSAAIQEAEEPEKRRSALLRSVGLDPSAPIDPKSMIADDAYYDLCERVAREDPQGASISVRVGSTMICDDYGAFGLAWKTALDLRGSFRRAERFWRVLTSVSTYEVRQENGRFFMMLHREGERRLGLRLSNEQTIVAVTQISREVSQDPFSPLAVFFKHPSPGDIAAHEAFFGCPVHFSADRDAIEVTEDQLRAANRLGDERVSEFFDAHLLKEISELEDEQGLEPQVRVQIKKALSEGAPSVADVAARLGMSGRTLQRRLAEQGRAFQDLVEESRRELAERLLRKTDYALAEVAFLTGFSEQSAFTRAFKRWSGSTPAHFRREQGRI